MRTNGEKWSAKVSELPSAPPIKVQVLGVYQLLVLVLESGVWSLESGLLRVLVLASTPVPEYQLNYWHSTSSGSQTTVNCVV